MLHGSRIIPAYGALRRNNAWEKPGQLATRFDVIGANCRSTRQNNYCPAPPGAVRLARQGVVGHIARLTVAPRPACYGMLSSLAGECVLVKCLPSLGFTQLSSGVAVHLVAR